MSINYKEEILQVRNLSAIFTDRSGGLRALENISFAVCPEEFVCVLGPSGSGKTTLLRTLAGLLPPSAGEIIFKGEALTGPRPGVGFVFQKPSLMPWRTVIRTSLCRWRSRMYPPQTRQEKAQGLIELVGLARF